MERAAFLLHDVFDYPYDEIAGIVDRSEAACRQLVSRARHRVDAPRRRFDADRAHGRELTRRFLVACGTGDLDGLLALLADDVTVWTDGGGQVRAALRPVTGPKRAARFLLSVARRVPTGVSSSEVDLNGQPGLVFALDGTVTMALTLDVCDGLVVDVRVVTNPDKLVALQPRGPRLSQTVRRSAGLGRDFGRRRSRSDRVHGRHRVEEHLLGVGVLVGVACTRSSCRPRWCRASPPPTSASGRSCSRSPRRHRRWPGPARPGPRPGPTRPPSRPGVDPGATSPPATLEILLGLGPGEDHVGRCRAAGADDDAGEGGTLGRALRRCSPHPCTAPAVNNRNW